MGQLDRTREAGRAVQRAALERWQRRQGERARNTDQVAAGGPGAADSPQRQARFSAREAGLAQARELRRRGMLPLGIERKMGATLDYVPFAPSDAARTAGKPVARLVDLPAAGIQAEGYATGFLVTSRLLLTNHHVFPSAGDAVGQAANFLFERTDQGTQQGILFELEPDAFFLGDERLDFTLVAIKPRSLDGRHLDELGIIALIEATPKILIGQPVNIIQYPQGGPKQYAITQNRLVDILDEGFLHYETDTLEGSSGSPAFSRNWELVALHHASIPQVRDGRVLAVDGTPWTEEMGDDRVRWIANEGARVSAIVKHLTEQQLQDPARQAILQALLASTTDPVDDLAQQVGGPPAATFGAAGESRPSPLLPYQGPAMAQNHFTFTGPVTIHIYAQPVATAPATAPMTAVPAESVVAVEKTLRFDPDYAGRQGYDPFFLGGGEPALVVPPPRIAAARLPEILLDERREPKVLKYHHFELVMNRRRRLQMWSAVNVDYARERKSEGGREAFGTDRWIPDPRIPLEAQLVDEDFYKPATKVDRGHVVRREDNAWGDSDDEIELANSDTFHWTNCTPQHEAFNRSTPGRPYSGEGFWGAFENHIQQSRKDGNTKACILAGPVLDNARDPTADFGRGPITYPLTFWKVVAIADRSGDGPELQVFGFLLSQQLVVRRFGIERFDPGRFKRFQAPLRQIEALAGLLFAERLHVADTMRGETERVEIAEPAQIRGLRAA
jgi:endonuclease G, mitochondrial